MSIIYDALKKSQQARAARPQIAVARRQKSKRKPIVITLLILTTLFIIIAAIMLPGGPSLMLPMFSQKAKAPTSALALVASPRLMLEGVFLSDTEKLAMINHRSYHVGDHINGMKVTTIAFDHVQLKNKSRSLTLRSEMTQLD